MSAALGTSVAFVALGANLGNPVAQLTAARRAIAAHPAFDSIVASSLYRTEAIGSLTPQPDYVNAVVRLNTSLTSLATWRILEAIERAIGRVRSGERNAARQIDIDLLLFDDEIVSTDELTLPHPRMHERAFVLRPLLELAPATVIPKHGWARSLLAAVATQRCERIAESSAWT